MPNIALIASRATEVDALIGFVDGYPETRHKLRVETTEYPVEDGVLVQDHAVARAERLHLRGWVSDQVGEGFADHARAARAATELRRLHRETALVEVTTELGTYRDMIITECDIEERGAGIAFELRLGQVLRPGVDAAGEITPETAGAGATERPSVVERGLVSPPPTAFSAATLRPVQPGDFNARLAESRQVASAFAETAAGRALEEAAERTLRDRIEERLRQEVERRAEAYFATLTYRAGRVVLDGEIGDAIRALPGVERADVSGRIESEGVRFRASVGTALGAWQGSLLLRARDQ